MTFHYQSAEEIGQAYRTSDVTPIDVTESLLSRIEQIDRELLSYATVMRIEHLKRQKQLLECLKTVKIWEHCMAFP